MLACEEADEDLRRRSETIYDAFTELDFAVIDLFLHVTLSMSPASARPHTLLYMQKCIGTIQR